MLRKVPLLGIISIHALLTESDISMVLLLLRMLNFYPRSPYGERHARLANLAQAVNFYPRSPYGERLAAKTRNPEMRCISIHALLTESDIIQHLCSLCKTFLSTLSLRRATLWGWAE